MASKEELDRLAAMGHALRPDWPARSLLTYLARSHATRPYRDLAVALATIATDATTQTPKRLEESGPWWRASQAVFVAGTPSVGPGRERCTVYGHEGYRASNCPGCRAEALIVGELRGGEPAPLPPSPPLVPAAEPVRDPRALAAGKD